MKRRDYLLFLSLGLFAVGPTALLVGCQSRSPGEPTVVEELPLERGYYALGGECGTGSNASLSLNTGNGINGARAHCSYTRIEKIRDKTYAVTEQCHHIRGGSQEREIEIVVESRTSFTQIVGDSTWSAQHCPQESLPEPWRSNDISRHLKTEG